jgi:hypothetical protein
MARVQRPGPGPWATAKLHYDAEGSGGALRFAARTAQPAATAGHFTVIRAWRWLELPGPGPKRSRPDAARKREQATAPPRGFHQPHAAVGDACQRRPPAISW